MKTNPKKTHRSGFALIVTLTMMILLTVIAVGLLTLSSVSIRTAGQTNAASIARNNARLGMMLALGELQRTMGTDASVSATADAVMSSPNRPHLTGVWQRDIANKGADSDAWHWLPGQNDAPDYAGKKDLFKGWLVSTAKKDDALSPTLPDAQLSVGQNAVSLVGDANNEEENNGVSTLVTAEKIKVGKKGQSGSYAWTVFDESTKAPINLGDLPAQTANEESASRAVPSRVRADVLDQKFENAFKTPSKLLTLDTAVVAGGSSQTMKEEFRRRFHDFTTDSLGLLTDTALGGLKVDLTSIFESDESNNFPSGTFTTPTGSNATTPYSNSLFNASAPKWVYLRDHYRKYRKITEVRGAPTYKVVPYSSASPLANQDLRINSDLNGIKASIDYERLIPVIAKFQLVFSIVSHNAHRPARVDFNNNNGTPKGNDKYAVPHLVYDPIITLYNPYDVALDLSKIRIRVWDPPVGFRFKKILYDSTPNTKINYRTDAYEGLAKFTSANENNDSARRTFTLVLTDGTNASAGTNLKLLPGEVRVFSPRVEDSWNWGKETAGNADGTYCFFDWQNADFGNRDNRTYKQANGVGKYGLECVPGWQNRAGLQLDHLSKGGARDASKYPYEKNPPAGTNGDAIGSFVSTKLTDGIQVEAKPMLAKGGAFKSFQIDILAGTNEGASGYDALKSDTNNAGMLVDNLRSFSFVFAGDPAAEMSATTGSSISREFTVGSILQRNSEKVGSGQEGPGGKKNFAILELTARTTKDDLTDSKPWLYNNAIVEGAVQTSSAVGLTNQSYDLRFYETSGVGGFPNGIDIDPDTFRGYFGASGSQQKGSSFVNMMHVPTAPAASLGDFVHSNLVTSSTLPRVVHALGNSRAHPLIPTASVSKNLGGYMVDHSYLLNDGLWDKYFFSSMADYSLSPNLDSRKRVNVLEDAFSGKKKALNTRLVPISSVGDASESAAKLDGLPMLELSRKMAANFAVSGAFNLNSTSVDAWRAVLSSLRDREVNGFAPDAATGNNRGLDPRTYKNDKSTPFVRSGRPLAGASSPTNVRWAGYKSLDDDQITILAKSIVKEITNRGVIDQAPAFSVGEFVNRRLDSSGSPFALAGVLQTAIDKTDINREVADRDGKTINYTGGVRSKNVATSDVMSGNTAEGSPGMLTQGDLMQALGAIATVRGDTFKIRSYGEATAADGITVTARAWCEVVVQRKPDFVDKANVPEEVIANLNETNLAFGRRFDIVSFRWLNEEEI